MKCMSILKRNLKEVVYGGSDGIVTTFAVVAGFAGSGGLGLMEQGYWIVVLFGFANLFADAASMGLGDFLSSRSQKDVVSGTEFDIEKSMLNNRKKLAENTRNFLLKEGMHEQDTTALMGIFERNSVFWKEFLLVHQYEYNRDEADHPLASALTTFFSFICFGLIPLLPFVFLDMELGVMFGYSIIATVVALILLGLLRYKVTEGHLVRSVAEALGIGGIAATIAYVIGIILG